MKLKFQIHVTQKKTYISLESLLKTVKRLLCFPLSICSYAGSKFDEMNCALQSHFHPQYYKNWLQI